MMNKRNRISDYQWQKNDKFDEIKVIETLVKFNQWRKNKNIIAFDQTLIKCTMKIYETDDKTYQ